MLDAICAVEDILQKRKPDLDRRPFMTPVVKLAQDQRGSRIENQRHLRGRPSDRLSGGLGRAQAVSRASHTEARASTRARALVFLAPRDDELKDRLHLRVRQLIQ